MKRMPVSGMAVSFGLCGVLAACVSGNQVTQSNSGSGNNVVCQQYSNCDVNPASQNSGSLEASPSSPVESTASSAPPVVATLSGSPTQDVSTSPPLVIVSTTAINHVVVTASVASSTLGVTEIAQVSAPIFASPDIDKVGQTVVGVTYNVSCRIVPSSSQPSSVSDGGWYELSDGYVAANTFDNGMLPNDNPYDPNVPVCNS